MYLRNPLASGTDGSDSLRPVKESVHPSTVIMLSLCKIHAKYVYGERTPHSPPAKTDYYYTTQKNTNMSNPGMA